jgi:HSP20 family molecular chaperone IbpA
MNNIIETPDKYEIAIDVPGIKKEDITLDVKDRSN